jgi:GAF domain-containing protein
MTAQDLDASRLHDILSAFYAARISRDEARSAVIDVVLDRLRCSRVSLWKFHGEDGELQLLCFASKVAGEGLDTTKRRLRQSEYCDYFNVLIESGTFVSTEALTDPALQAMRESYLLPNKVVSVLDAAFTLNGRAYGMICCEETLAKREWRAAEVSALRSIVTRLALQMSGAVDSMLWSTPSRPLQPIAAERAPPDPRRR